MSCAERPGLKALLSNSQISGNTVSKKSRQNGHWKCSQSQPQGLTSWKSQGLRLDATPVLLVAVVVQEDLAVAEGRENQWQLDPFSRPGLSLKLKDFQREHSQWLGYQFPQKNTSATLKYLGFYIKIKVYLFRCKIVRYVSGLINGPPAPHVPSSGPTPFLVTLPLPVRLISWRSLVADPPNSLEKVDVIGRFLHWCMTHHGFISFIHVKQAINLPSQGLSALRNCMR